MDCLFLVHPIFFPFLRRHKLGTVQISKTFACKNNIKNLLIFTVRVQRLTLDITRPCKMRDFTQILRQYLYFMLWRCLVDYSGQFWQMNGLVYCQDVDTSNGNGVENKESSNLTQPNYCTAVRSQFNSCTAVRSQQNGCTAVHSQPNPRSNLRTQSKLLLQSQSKSFDQTTVQERLKYTMNPCTPEQNRFHYKMAPQQSTTVHKTNFSLLR